MDLDQIERYQEYRHLGTGLPVIALAMLPGEPSEDDPTGPIDADMVMVRYRGDDHKFLIDPADLESIEEPDDMVPFIVTREMILTRRVDEL
jgi:hypothetical protein